MNKSIAQLVKCCYKPNMIVHGFVDKKHIQREKEKARQLKKSQWWKQKLAEGLCHYCGKGFAAKDLTMDHRTPMSRGGSSSKGNVVPCCKACNSEKKYFTPVEMILRENEPPQS